jgi:hypothetical protein
MTTQAHPLRSNVGLWYCRFLQLAFTLVALGLSAEAKSIWKDLTCHTPSNVLLNIIVVCFDLQVLPTKADSRLT